MSLTRKEFMELTGKAAFGAGALSTFDFVWTPPGLMEILQEAEIRKIHDHIARSKEEHIAKVQADLRQPSVSSWSMGIKEMADRMVDSFRALGTKEADLVPTDGNPGVWGYYDAGKPKTIVVYMMYDTQPWVEERWSSPPLAANRVKLDPFDEVIMARGAINSKGPNRLFLNALESIIAVTGTLPVNVMFTCDGEEEQGSPHFHQVLDPYRDRLRKANCLLGAGPAQQRDGSVSMSLGNKGILEMEIEAHGARWGRGPQKMPIHSSRKAVLDSPVWRLVDALRSMYDPKTNRILVDGYYNDMRPPNEEEELLIQTLVTRFRDRLFASDSENLKVFMNDWTPEEAARHLTFDTTLNIDGIWAGYTGPGMATILPEKAAVKLDSRLVPNQAIATQKERVLAHLAKHGFTDLEVRQLGGGDEWSQTSVKEPVVQAVLGVYKKYGIEPLVWPRSPGSSPQWEYTRKLELPAASGGLGHGSRAHSDDEYIVIAGNEKVAGIVKAQQSIVDILYAYASWPESGQAG
ncbi:MAG: M20/M25/M40 family metallo-hydrolase [Gemmatimonadetes bacterium]|nr:M20/M25/M40 family metallo-hydrolase [Gemmatimonadota bacterium]